MVRVHAREILLAPRLGWMTKRIGRRPVREGNRHRDAACMLERGEPVRVPREPPLGRRRQRADVSGWLAGWIVGIEWDPYGVERTDEANRVSPRAVERTTVAAARVAAR